MAPPPVARLHPSGDGYELLGTRFAELEFGPGARPFPGMTLHPLFSCLTRTFNPLLKTYV